MEEDGVPPSRSNERASRLVDIICWTGKMRDEILGRGTRGRENVRDKGRARC